MKVWLTCVFLLFAFSELYQWAKTLSLPLPIYILGGAFLAIASNYNKLNGWAWQLPVVNSQPIINSPNQPSLGNKSPQTPQFNHSQPQVKLSQPQKPQ